MTILTSAQSLIFMKVGVHAQEPLESIIERKQQEFRDAGMIFWGYGGNTCHPFTMVQPFAKEQEQLGREIILVMEEIASNHRESPIDSERYQDDGVSWKSVPSGIHVKGSKYALILDQLQFGEMDLNLRQARVAVGPTRGRPAHEYIRNRVDKGCIEFNPQLPIDEFVARDVHKIRLFAKLKPPYAVVLG